MNTWIYDKNIDPLDYIGFVYIIENMVTRQKYIGKKKCWVQKAKKLHKQSDWQTYWGSNKDLLEELEQDIYGEEHYERRVLHWCVSPGEMSWLELVELVKRDALTARLPSGLPEYYNGNILMSFNHKIIQGYQDPTRRAKYLDTHSKQRKNTGL